MARILKGSHSFTCTPCVHLLTEWTIPAFAFPAEAGTHLPTPEVVMVVMGTWTRPLQFAYFYSRTNDNTAFIDVHIIWALLTLENLNVFFMCLAICDAFCALLFNLLKNKDADDVGLMFVFNIPCFI